MKKLILVLILFAIISFFLYAILIPHNYVSYKPLYDCEGLITINQCEDGETAIADFEIRNQGNSVLHISDIKTSCSCTGVYSNSPNPKRVYELFVQAHSSEKLRASIQVHGKNNSEVFTSVSFVTNDSSQSNPSITIHIKRVIKPIFSVPDVFNFGTAQIGSEINSSLNICDNTKNILSEENFSCSNKAIKFFFESFKNPKYLDSGEFVIGVLHVSIDTKNALDIDDNILINSGTSKNFKIKVAGRVVDTILFTPKKIYIPKNSVKSTVAQLSIHSIDNVPLKAEIHSKPEYLNVEFTLNNQTEFVIAKISFNSRNFAIDKVTDNLVLKISSVNFSKLITVPLLINDQE